MIKKLYYGLVTLVLISLIVNFSRKAFNLWRSGGKIEEKRKELVALEGENQELKKRAVEVGSPRFIEQEAREKLGLGKENEVVVILPSPEVSKEESLTPREKTSNWEKWWQLFVY